MINFFCAFLRIFNWNFSLIIWLFCSVLIQCNIGLHQIWEKILYLNTRFPRGLIVIEMFIQLVKSAHQKKKYDKKLFLAFLNEQKKMKSSQCVHTTILKFTSAFSIFVIIANFHRRTPPHSLDFNSLVKYLLLKLESEPHWKSKNTEIQKTNQKGWVKWDSRLSH